MQFFRIKLEKQQNIYLVSFLMGVMGTVPDSTDSARIYFIATTPKSDSLLRCLMRGVELIECGCLYLFPAR